MQLLEEKMLKEKLQILDTRKTRYLINIIELINELIILIPRLVMFPLLTIPH